MPNNYQLRVYFLPYNDNWERLRLMASPPPNETAPAGIARRVLYRNAALTNLAHAKAKPADRPALFQSLVNSAAAKHSFCGVESMYLSLLADPTVRTLPACAQSLLLWHGRVALDSADEGAFFFNEKGDRLSYLSPATVKTLNPSDSTASFVGSRSFAATSRLLLDPSIQLQARSVAERHGSLPARWRFYTPRPL